MKEYVELRDMPPYQMLMALPLESMLCSIIDAILFNPSLFMLLCCRYANSTSYRKGVSRSTSSFVRFVHLIFIFMSIDLLISIIFVSDDLAELNLILGNAYIITGIYDGTEKSFVAWNVTELKDD